MTVDTGATLRAVILFVTLLMAIVAVTWRDPMPPIQFAACVVAAAALSVSLEFRRY